MVAEALGADNVIALQGDAQMAVFEGWGCVKGRACGGKGIRRFVVCGCGMSVVTPFLAVQWLWRHRGARSSENHDATSLRGD